MPKWSRWNNLYFNFFGSFQEINGGQLAAIFLHHQCTYLQNELEKCYNIFDQFPSYGETKIRS
ncbi:MAG TPA: hypothetical protein DCL08_08290 [Anaerolineaceae bacterium]|nr:hypothetical protein [Anaerolineaceae bacterium]